MRHCLLLSVICSGLMLNACTPARHAKPQPPRQAVQAQRLLQSGDPAQAAQLYQQLAEQDSSDQNLYRLLAAETLFDTGNSTDAQRYIAQIDIEKLSPPQRSRLNLLNAQIHLSFGAAEQALALLERIPVGQLSQADQISYYQSRAFAYSLTGKLLKSAQQRVSLSRLLDNPQQLQDNRIAILETLMLLSDETLQSMQPPAPDVLGGWMALARTIKSKAQDPMAFDRAINQWRQRFPKHPANSDFLTAYLEKIHPTYRPAQSVAVLLPESGPYAKAAAAVRAGFEAAYRQDSQNFKPEIRYYDSTADDPAALYQQAKSQGAELIIGPLSKQNMTRLVETSELTVPVLALNHISGLVKTNLFQFGLSPIDDVEQIVNRALSDGHKKSLVLIPNTELGQRQADYFNEFWTSADGAVLEIQVYNPKASDFSLPIRQLLNLDESENRHDHISRLLPGVRFSPRRRHDADIIFISGSPDTARLLNPQLHFYYANDLPVYGTAQLYGSRPDPARDIDLSGVTFCDIPWLFDDNYLNNLSVNALQQGGLQMSGAYLKLVALGIDAYNLIAQLPTLNSKPYAGATGNLRMNGDYRIKRQLQCAKFVRGYPQLLGTTEGTPNDEFDQETIVDSADRNPFHDR